MGHRIHLFGASGSGTTTLGAALARDLAARHLDTDHYYWKPTDPPFTDKFLPSERVAMIERDIETSENWILSGSLCNWGDPLLDRFTCAVFLRLDPAIRIRRLRCREWQRYGSRIADGGDMQQQHREFIAWAESYDTASAPTRSLDLHRRWMPRLRCPVLQLDSSNDVESLAEQVRGFLLS